MKFQVQEKARRRGEKKNKKFPALGQVYCPTINNPFINGFNGINAEFLASIPSMTGLGFWGSLHHLEREAE